MASININSQSIKDIKTSLENVYQKNIYKDNITEINNFIEIYSSDDRVGVQKLVKAYKNKLKKYASLKIKLQDMMRFENIAYNNGYNLIAGIDEVGRGPLAGPVVTAAVILPKEFNILGIDDSKKLSEAKRNELYDLIIKNAIDFHVNVEDNIVIDQINILQATKKSMLKNIENLKIKPDYLIIDAVNLNTSIPNRALPKADENSVSVAAASILAKVTRDKMMKEYSQEYPNYGFEKNKGYGVEMHIEALKKYGYCEIHRKSFIKNII